LPVTCFPEYCGLFHGSGGTAYVKPNTRREVLVTKSDGDGFQQSSFVNSISTPKAGTHVQYIVDQLVDAILAVASKRNKGGPEIKRVHVKNHLSVFVN